MMRSKASEALVTLRRTLGCNQQRFSSEILQIAIGTLARYETSNPPTGDLLIRLSEIALQHYSGRDSIEKFRYQQPNHIDANAIGEPPCERDDLLLYLYEQFRALYMQEVLDKLQIKGCVAFADYSKQQAAVSQ
jgi:hypothetical protein